MIAYIDRHKERFGVEPIGGLLPIAPSTYYEARSRPPSARALREQELKPEIARVHAEDFSVYGARKVLPPQLRARCTKFWPGAVADQLGEQIPEDLADVSEWTHEREWRVLGTGEPSAFRFSPEDVAFLIIGDWDSANRSYACVVVYGGTGDIEDRRSVWLPRGESSGQVAS